MGKKKAPASLTRPALGQKIAISAGIRRFRRLPPEGLFDQQWHRSQWDNVFSIDNQDIHLTPSVVNEAISSVFLLDQEQRPHYVLLLAGSEYYLLHYEKWGRGSYLRFTLEDLFDA